MSYYGNYTNLLIPKTQEQSVVTVTFTGNRLQVSRTHNVLNITETELW